MTEKRPCDQCPWRLANQGQPHARGFYTKANLTRLWNQVRGGGSAQSCHLTDPSHPDHVEAGAKPGATAQECPGSVILVLREVRRMADATGHVDGSQIAPYLATRKKGLKKLGILYWMVQRISMGGVPYVGGEVLPEVDIDDADVGLPAHLQEG